MPASALFDEVTARLPLFDGLPQDAFERLSVLGLGRGLLTAGVRARLRKAGFVDMGALAAATPAEITEVRKIGPVRLRAIRTHVLNEIARALPDARTIHAAGATASLRMDRLRTMPTDRLPLDEAALEELGCTGKSCADVAMRGRGEWLRTRSVTAGDLDRVVVTLVRFLRYDGPHVPRVALVNEGNPAKGEAQLREERARVLRERDREWDEAAPAARSRGDRSSRR